MDPGAAPEEAARRLAVRLTEHLARSGRAAVVEVVEEEGRRAAVELRVPGDPTGPSAEARSFRWTVDPEHPETQFRDLRLRIDLLLIRRRPEESTPAAGRAWCQWE